VKLRGVCEKKHALLCDLQGFSAVWDASGTVLTCVEQQKHAQHKSVIVAVAVAVAAVLAVALIVWRQYLRTRPRWLRERVLQVGRSLLDHILLLWTLLCCLDPAHIAAAAGLQHAGCLRPTSTRVTALSSRKAALPSA
jgi:hypothetical protein